MIATKFRALLQRNKGRDLYDLSYALEVFTNLDTDRIIDLFNRYLALSNLTISKAQAQERMFAKLANPSFLTDIRPLVSAEQAENFTPRTTQDAIRRVFETLISRLRGDDWENTRAVKERFGLEW